MSENIAIGIDLGTTRTATAYWNELEGRPVIIPDAEGHRVTPSYVAFTQPKPNAKTKTEKLIGH